MPVCANGNPQVVFVELWMETMLTKAGVQDGHYIQSHIIDLFYFTELMFPILFAPTSRHCSEMFIKPMSLDCLLSSTGVMQGSLLCPGCLFVCKLCGWSLLLLSGVEYFAAKINFDGKNLPAVYYWNLPWCIAGWSGVFWYTWQDRCIRLFWSCLQHMSGQFLFYHKNVAINSCRDGLSVGSFAV